VLWLRLLVAGLWLRRPGFDPRPVHVRYVADTVTWEIFLTEYSIFPLSVSFHQWAHIHLQLYVAVTRRT